MKTDFQSLLLLCAGVVFFVYLVVRMVITPRVARDGKFQQARTRIAEAKRTAGDASASPSVRSAAMRDAALAALEGLRHPSLAASYARRAERMDPGAKAEATGLLAQALRRGHKYRALERILWRGIADAEASDEQRARALEELISLYEGALYRPEAAEGLRRLKADKAG